MPIAACPARRPNKPAQQSQVRPDQLSGHDPFRELVGARKGEDRDRPPFPLPLVGMTLAEAANEGGVREKAAANGESDRAEDTSEERGRQAAGHVGTVGIRGANRTPIPLSPRPLAAAFEGLRLGGELTHASPLTARVPVALRLVPKSIASTADRRLPLKAAA